MSSALEEHIDYLTLEGRYELFEAAFGKVIRSGDLVADLGCGVGVLGLQCIKAGAAKVYGIDNSSAIYLARETMDRAGFADNYASIPGSTFDTEISEPVDALVCDHVGYFGFDYGLIDMIRDAAARMLKPDGVIVPDKLILHAAAASSKEFRRMASVWDAAPVPPEYRWLGDQNRNCKFGVQAAADDICSQSTKLGEIDLNAETRGFFSYNADLIVERPGLFDGILGWFDCHLGGDVWMTNSPLEDRSIGRPHAFLPVLEPFEVVVGDRVGLAIKFDSSGDFISWTITPPAIGLQKPRPQKLSTFNSTVLAPEDLSKHSDEPILLSQHGEACLFVLSKVNGVRSLDEIVAIVIEQRPDLMPTQAAIKDFVEALIKQEGACDGSN